MRRFRPERADSLGLILHYACTNRCGHCLYASGPGLREEIDPGAWDVLLGAVQQACPGAPVHVGGGEPFLHLDRLLEVIRGLRQRGIPLEYVETNGFWVRQPRARERLEAVRRAGCDCLLLSISPFHNAFLSCEDNERAYRMIVEVFGPQGIFPWHPGHYPFLRRADPCRPVPFEEYVQHFDRRELEYQLFGINYLHPAGRAAWTLSRTRHQPQWREAAGCGPQQAAAAGPRQTSLLPGRPAEAWLGKRCSADLSSPVHAHVDARGRYLTGFCSGLQIGDRQAFDLRSLFEEGIPLADFPVLEMLVEGGLASLFGSASRQGFLPDPEGYVSACHLCVHLRTWLFCRLPGEQRPKELAPDFFYEEMRRLAGL